MAFQESGLMLLSGGEDTLVCAWLLSELLDVAQDTTSAQYSRPQPLYSWYGQMSGSQRVLKYVSTCVFVGL